MKRRTLCTRLSCADKSVVLVGFTAKGTARSAVAVSHTKLPDRESANQRKEYWSARLDALGEILTGE